MVALELTVLVVQVVLPLDIYLLHQDKFLLYWLVKQEVRAALAVLLVEAVQHRVQRVVVVVVVLLYN